MSPRAKCFASNEEFVHIWESARAFADVQAIYPATKRHTLYNRADRLRRAGVRLQKFVGPVHRVLPATLNLIAARAREAKIADEVDQPIVSNAGGR